MVTSSAIIYTKCFIMDKCLTSCISGSFSSLQSNFTEPTRMPTEHFHCLAKVGVTRWRENLQQVCVQTNRTPSS